MPIYDNNIDDNNQAHEFIQPVLFADAGFYPFLKYLINKTTRIPNSNIYTNNYGEHNPFQNHNTKKAICSLIDFKTPSMTHELTSDGNVSVYCFSIYRVYFIYDPFLSAIAIENVIKGDVRKLEEITKEFKTAHFTDKTITSPSTISMRDEKKIISDRGIIPMVVMDIILGGKIYYNIEELANRQFTNIDSNIKIN